MLSFILGNASREKKKENKFSLYKKCLRTNCGSKAGLHILQLYLLLFPHSSFPPPLLVLKNIYYL